MSRKCPTGKGVQTGHRVSHSNVKSNHRFLPNLQKKRFWSDTQSRYKFLKSDRERPLLAPETIFLSDEDFFKLVKPHGRWIIQQGEDSSEDSTSERAIPGLLSTAVSSLASSSAEISSPVINKVCNDRRIEKYRTRVSKKIDFAAHFSRIYPSLAGSERRKWKRKLHAA